MSDNHEGSPRARLFVIGLIVLGFGVLVVTAIFNDGHGDKNGKKYGSAGSVFTVVLS